MRALSPASRFCTREEHLSLKADDAAFRGLPYAGTQAAMPGLAAVAGLPAEDPLPALEMRNCPHCGSTLARGVDSNGNLLPLEET